MNTLKTFLISLKQGEVSDMVLFVQKWVADYVFRLLGWWGFGRQGFTSLGGNTLFQFKTPQDIEVGSSLFRGKKQYILTGSDVLRKGEVSGIFEDSVLEEIPSEEVWGSPSTLSVFGSMSSLEKMVLDTPPDIIYTRWTPTLTKRAVDIAYPESDVVIREVDGNTEAFVALNSSISPNSIVCGTEFVQTGWSLEATRAFILREDGIYEPHRWRDGRFLLLQKGRSRSSEIFAQALTIEVQILFAKIIPQHP